MTKVNIISGFLGAGKTTLIKKLLEGGAFAGEKLVLLENEYGEVGVDGAFLQNTGIQISELNSGCICCTLVGDFEIALKDIIQKYSPDRVIIEPSGVGKLSEVRAVVAKISQEAGLSLEACATVADVNRCRVYARNFGEFFSDQIETAECIVLSRTQMTTPEKLNRAVEMLRGLNPDARIVTTPWDELDAKTLFEAIRAETPLVDAHDHDHEHCDHDHGHCEHEHHDHKNCDHDHGHCEHEHHDHKHCDHDHGHCEHEHHDHKNCDHDHGHCEHDHHDHKNCDHDHGHCEHDHHHAANEVFENIGVETTKVFTEKEIKSALDALHDVDRFGSVLRAKGVLRLDDGSWAHFDYVPGASEIRRGSADYTGRLCVIGVSLDSASIKGLFGL